jgi:hypothetical protein
MSAILAQATAHIGTAPSVDPKVTLLVINICGHEYLQNMIGNFWLLNMPTPPVAVGSR